MDIQTVTPNVGKFGAETIMEVYVSNKVGLMWCLTKVGSVDTKLLFIYES